MEKAIAKEMRLSIRTAYCTWNKRNITHTHTHTKEKKKREREREIASIILASHVHGKYFNSF